MNNFARKKIMKQASTQAARRRIYLMNARSDEKDIKKAGVKVRVRSKKDFEDIEEYFDYSDKRVSER